MNKKDISRFLITPGITVRAAMKLLDSSHNKILFLTDNEGQLIGSLSDGDIRRWILSEGNLEEDVKHVCHKKPYAIDDSYNLESVKKEIQKNKFTAVPIVDDRSRVIDILFWNEVFRDQPEKLERKRLDSPVIIMAGGQGTRLEPFTKILPKPLIPIGDKTIIEVIINKFLDYHVENFYLSLNYKAKIIKSYFEELQPKYKITYLYEDKPLGTAGGLKQLEGKIANDILITNCDIIIEADYANLIKHHKEQKNDITLVASLKQYIIPYGICEIENGGSLTAIIEKPEYNFLVSTGMYIVNHKVLKYIPKNQLYHITHLIEEVKNNNGKVGIYPISENSWIDTGEWVEYKKTIEKFNL